MELQDGAEGRGEDGLRLLAREGLLAPAGDGRQPKQDQDQEA
jgi:hypothetical protein